MPSFLKKSVVRYPLYLLVAISTLTVVTLGYYNQPLAIVLFAVHIIVFVFFIRMEFAFRKETEQFALDFSKRFSTISEEAISELPIGVLLYSENWSIEWHNHFMQAKFEELVEIGKPLDTLSAEIKQILMKKTEDQQVTIGDRTYQVDHNKKHHLIYLTDVTEMVELNRKYLFERNVIAMLFLDSYDDATQGMDDQEKSSLQNVLTSEVMRWATENDILLRRVASDRFIALLNEGVLEQLEKSKFHILDDVRNATLEHGVPLTLSIGVGSGAETIPELGMLAQSGLDLALGRGGDQAVIKAKNGKARFYGGKTSPMGKRTRVRARVISHALRELINDSENVIIMGHKQPDMDVYGPAIGLLKVVEVNDRSGFIVMDKGDVDPSLEPLFTEIKKNEELFSKFVTAEKALEKVTEKALLIVVDTHKPSLVIEEKLLKAVSRVVVIDHHRRGEETIENPILSYMEPYASSTSELVTEIIEYHPKIKKLDILAATVLLAGIMVDTKSFTLRTGARTFGAASFLRLHGADLAKIQDIFKEDVEQYIERNKLIETVYFYKEGLAIAKNNHMLCSSVQIAKAADTLLSMNSVQASFVVARRLDNLVSISARSLGDVNVQIIMEKLAGGGHLTNAAAQIVDATVEEAEEMLQQAIEVYLEGRSES